MVYGHPALAFAVHRGTRATLTRRPGPLTVTAYDEPLDVTTAASIAAAVARVLPSEGIGLSLRSTLPLGRGMGSSAALSVAVVRAWSVLCTDDLDDQACRTKASAIEQVFHGNPSGLDVAVSVHGGALWYRRGEPPELRPVAAPEGQWAVLDTGAAGNTAALVAGVASRRPGVDAALSRIGALTALAEAALQDPSTLGPILNENQARLAEIGVSTDQITELCEFALAHGALGAKLSGAGGGGVVLALCNDAQRLVQAATLAGLRAFTVHPEGLS